MSCRGGSEERKEVREGVSLGGFDLFWGVSRGKMGVSLGGFSGLGGLGGAEAAEADDTVDGADEAEADAEADAEAEGVAEAEGTEGEGPVITVGMGSVGLSDF